jgi:hypothetical protein
VCALRNRVRHDAVDTDDREHQCYTGKMLISVRFKRSGATRLGANVVHGSYVVDRLVRIEGLDLFSDGRRNELIWIAAVPLRSTAMPVTGDLRDRENNPARAWSPD